MKQAKGFSLAELDQDQNTFELDTLPQTQKSPDSSEAIVLDILADSSQTTATVTSDTTSPALTTSALNTLKNTYNKLNSIVIFQKRVPVQDKAIFFELIGTMLQAGISLVQSMKIFRSQTTNLRLKSMAENLSLLLEKGESLSKSLDNYSDIFTEAEIGMIKAGEVTGRLAEVLKRLATEATALVELQQKIKSALTYPTVVVFFVFVTMYILLRFVIPQMTELFTSSNLELPTLTKFVIAASDIVINHTLLFILSLSAVAFALYSINRTPSGRLFFHTFYLKIPVLKDFLKYIYQASFSRSLSNLLNAGVSIVDAVKITSRSTVNLVYKNKINSIAKDVTKGITISDSIQGSEYFSSLTSSMIAVGEKTAQLDELAKKVAEYYEGKTSNMADNFTKLIQPFVIAIIGTLVAVIVLAIMLPMTSLIGGVDAL